MSVRKLFMLAAILLAVAGVVVRQMNVNQAHLLASQVVAADVADASISAPLDSLRSYAATHMGASVTLSLTGSYNRAESSAAAATEAAAKAQSANAQIYANAQQYCMSKANSIVQAECNAAYLQQHLVATPSPTAVAAPKLADYQVSVVAPVWTPDLAGALFAGALVALVLSPFVPKRRLG
jgi:hypothetical protein